MLLPGNREDYAAVRISCPGQCSALSLPLEENDKDEFPLYSPLV